MLKIMKTIKLLLVAALVSLFASANAQTKEKPWTLGLYGVRTVYIGDLGTGIFDFDQDANVGVGVSFDRYISRFFDLGLYGSYSSISYYDGMSSYADMDDFYNRIQTGNLPKNFKSSPMYSGNVHLRYKFLGNNEARLVPYINVGVSMFWYKNDETQIYVGGNVRTESLKSYNGQTWSDIKSIYSTAATAGIGLEYKFTPALSVRYQADFSYTNHDNRDFYQKGGNDMQLQHNLGLAWSFGGKKKDSDGDGVADKNDLCPNTPAGVTVDVNGCPIDSDGDGVADYLDQCPNTPAAAVGYVDAKGCPKDSDGDGVADYLDKCPNTPAGAKVDANGCTSDSDGDGVADYMDKCPNTPAGVQVDKNGCPVDTDGDGIPDYLDQCPKVKGVKENNGCPAVEAAAYSNIMFDSSKYTIKPGFDTELDQVAKTLKDNPSYTLKVDGHADTSGIAEKNMILSQHRANSVKNYIVKKGVNGSRIDAKGHGDKQPVADNSTWEGRTQNRRVELSIIK